MSNYTKVLSFLKEKGILEEDIDSIAKLAMLNYEWEMDCDIWVVSLSSIQNGVVVVGTNHGSPCFVSQQEVKAP